MTTLNDMCADDILAADRVLDAGKETRNILSSAVAIGCGAYTVMGLISNPVGWSVGATAVAVSMLRGGLITAVATNIWHQGEIRSKAGWIRFAMTFNKTRRA